MSRSVFIVKRTYVSTLRIVLKERSAVAVDKCHTVDKCHRASVHNGIKKLIQTAPSENLHSLNLCISFDDQYQKVNTNSQQRDHTTF